MCSTCLQKGTHKLPLLVDLGLLQCSLGTYTSSSPWTGFNSIQLCSWLQRSDGAMLLCSLARLSVSKKPKTLAPNPGATPDIIGVKKHMYNNTGTNTSEARNVSAPPPRGPPRLSRTSWRPCQQMSPEALPQRSSWPTGARKSPAPPTRP